MVKNSKKSLNNNKSKTGKLHKRRYSFRRLKKSRQNLMRGGLGGDDLNITDLTKILTDEMYNLYPARKAVLICFGQPNIIERAKLLLEDKSVENRLYSYERPKEGPYTFEFTILENAGIKMTETQVKEYYAYIFDFMKKAYYELDNVKFFNVKEIGDNLYFGELVFEIGSISRYPLTNSLLQIIEYTLNPPEEDYDILNIPILNVHFNTDTLDLDGIKLTKQSIEDYDRNVKLDEVD